MVYREVPNKYGTEFVESDGHFCLFGVTLLDRDRARAYHACRFRHPYDVGHYLDRQDYEALFRQYGMAPELIPSVHHPTRPFSERADCARRLLLARENFQRQRRSLPGPI